MQRRQALAFVGVAALCGCSGLARYARSRLKGCPELQPLPNGGMATRVVAMTLQSKHVSKPVGVWTIEVGRHPMKRIVWALPGRGDDAAGQPAFLQPYAAQLGIDGLAIVTIGGGESYWHPRSSGEDRLAMLLDEAIPWARREYNVASSMGIIGWSMGGYGAINAAEQSPGTFDRVCGVSPALWQNASEQHSAVPDAFDDAASFERFNPFRHAALLRGAGVRISCGSHDPFYPNAVAFARTLERDHVPVQTDFFEHGCHDTASWQKTIGADLAFVTGLPR